MLTSFAVAGEELTAAVERLAARPGFLVSQLGFHGARRFNAKLEPLGIRAPHFGLLVRLGAFDGQTQQQLADSMAVHRNAMVGLIDELERLGLVERRRHPTDRRAYALHLTEAGRAALAKAQRAADQHDDELLEPLDESDRRRLIDLLARLAEHGGLAPGVHPRARVLGLSSN
jgi:DNA-binding MarR family transcriptional regulator